MKIMETQPRGMLFTGVLDAIAESFGRPSARALIRPAKEISSTARSSGASESVPAPAHPPPEGWLARIGRWLWRRQIRGVAAHVHRADDTFAALDRWLWKQRMRETEAWLAESQDIFELETRMRELERGRFRGNF